MGLAETGQVPKIAHGQHRANGKIENPRRKRQRREPQNQAGSGDENLQRK